MCTFKKKTLKPLYFTRYKSRLKICFINFRISFFSSSFVHQLLINVATTKRSWAKLANNIGTYTASIVNSTLR